MSETYRFRRAESAEDGARLHALFTPIFLPEAVGVFAETLFRHHPDCSLDHWFIAEEKASSEVVSAFALLPRTLEMEGVSLKTAEMGIVGTAESHRKKGLMKALVADFFQTLDAEAYDLSIIQGIPGFYGQFGYHFAVPLENHISVPFHAVPDKIDPDCYSFQLATAEDIPFLLEQDQAYRKAFCLSTVRRTEHWEYMFGPGRGTDTGSDFWIQEHRTTGEAWYFRIPDQGFGKGLIINEISEKIPFDAFSQLLGFCAGIAQVRNKPYLRLNLHNDSPHACMAASFGARPGRPYAWQIKIPSLERFLTTLTPLLERRLAESSLKGYTGTFRLDRYSEKTDLVWKEGRLETVQPGRGSCPDIFQMNAVHMPALCLGHLDWRTVHPVSPDVYPASARTDQLMGILFPRKASWLLEPF